MKWINKKLQMAMSRLNLDNKPGICLKRWNNVETACIVQNLKLIVRKKPNTDAKDAQRLNRDKFLYVSCVSKNFISMKKLKKACFVLWKENLRRLKKKMQTKKTHLHKRWSFKKIRSLYKAIRHIQTWSQCIFKRAKIKKTLTCN